MTTFQQIPWSSCEKSTEQLHLGLLSPGRQTDRMVFRKSRFALTSNVVTKTGWGVVSRVYYNRPTSMTEYEN